MTLPPLTIPNIPLPFEIPQMMHPLFVHFAIALPVLVLLLELINLFVKKRTIGVLSFFFMVLIAGVFLAAYMTGVTDGKAAKEFLSPEAKALLGEHKQLGIYLVYASGILMLFKLFSVMVRKPVIRVLFFIVLIAFTAAVFNEGKKGGALVYEYGVNVKSVPAISEQKQAAKIEESKTTNSDNKTSEVKAENNDTDTDSNASTVSPETSTVDTADSSENNVSVADENSSR